MSGRRRAPRPAGRRRRVWAVAGVLTVVVAVCAVAALAFLRPGKARTTADRATTGPMSAPDGSERDVVPDACTALSQKVADQLTPGAERTEMDQATDADRHSECAWSIYGNDRRQLTVELRALTGDGTTGATGVATRTFGDEWDSDRAGKDLADTVKVRDSRGVSGVGEQAYVVYTVDNDDIGDAVANARLANVLVTVHFSGGDDKDGDMKPISSSDATNGALSAARDVISKLQSQS
ncbi:hypothetical protein [Actinoallomurus rhizosphaericola]|uniref:hypothetical protein n=1 Tax=Actinoallomurus rhizosphaericola TaxID=2952536 RepID=UPI002090E28B|nr:hypothetical protein [Actinoallomurus rhizosphaericola]MCO5994749.1 hypothetical protein [Actinoallomurus rhizosphaericola]